MPVIITLKKLQNNAIGRVNKTKIIRCQYGLSDKYAIATPNAKKAIINLIPAHASATFKLKDLPA